MLSCVVLHVDRNRFLIENKFCLLSKQVCCLSHLFSPHAPPRLFHFNGFFRFILKMSYLQNIQFVTQLAGWPVAHPHAARSRTHRFTPRWGLTANTPKLMNAVSA